MNFRRVLSGVLVIAAVGAIGWGAAYGIEEGRKGAKFSALFEASVGLYPGSDVQILGVPVGKVTEVKPDGEHVKVTMELDPGQAAAADTEAVIVAPMLVSDRFVQLTEPHVDGPKLRDGTVIEETAVPVEIDDLYASLTDAGEKLGPEGANQNGALSRLLKVLAANLDGQGADINQVIGETADASATLANVDQDFFATVEHLNTFNNTLLAHDDGVRDANRQFAQVTQYLAEDRDDLASAVTNLGEALGMLEGFIEDNRGQMRSSVENLQGPTQVLADQNESLEEAVATIPQLLQKYVNAYDPSTNTLVGRTNLNEISPVWSRDGLSAKTSEEAPPVLLPGVGEEQ
ncbi:virulence factor Mce-like protein [Nocardioides albertanoniae]|uniref:Virulence factor Mce-like protein n=1 Tax=Nocardioides albertanoniae TaxID=1175486 RepID=A0A543A2J6_9ACTN|nr:MCE family protein [Nocardioides albertanoniae]TQL66818.1 virulence factor Mce-like protein [Nocardioides albertanoniae]